MAFRLFGAKPSYKLMPAYFEIDPQGQTSVKAESKNNIFHSEK